MLKTIVCVKHIFSADIEDFFQYYIKYIGQRNARACASIRILIEISELESISSGNYAFGYLNCWRVLHLTKKKRDVYGSHFVGGLIYLSIVGRYKLTISTQRPGSPKNTTQHHDVSVQSTLDRRPMYYSQKMDPSSPNANAIMWTHTSLAINIKFK